MYAATCEHTHENNTVTLHWCEKRIDRPCFAVEWRRVIHVKEAPPAFIAGDASQLIQLYQKKLNNFHFNPAEFYSSLCGGEPGNRHPER